MCCRADAASDVHRDGFAKALKAGVKMALGSDIRPLKDAALLELGLWVRDGATPWEALVAATRNGAAVCGVGNERGPERLVFSIGAGRQGRQRGER